MENHDRCPRFLLAGAEEECRIPVLLRMSVGDREEILKYYELHETIGTGRLSLLMRTNVYGLSNCFSIYLSVDQLLLQNLWVMFQGCALGDRTLKVDSEGVVVIPFFLK